MQHRVMIRLLSRLAVVAGLAAFALTGCSSGEDTNGLEGKSAAEVQQEAAAALKAAASVHVTSTGTTDGKPAQIDLRIRGASSSGSLTLAETRLEIIRIEEDLYVKGTREALTAFGAPAATQRLSEVKWLKLGPQHLTSLDGFTTDDLATQLTKFDSPLEPKVEQTTLDGAKVVVISQQNGSKLYVANTGTAYPLRGVIKGKNAGQIDFTEYGASFDITAPPDAVDLTELRADEPEPLSGEEVGWLERVGGLHEEIDKALDSVNDKAADRDQGLTQLDISELARILPKCSSELVPAGPPSARMQPVYELVVQACREYDKGAACFATADRIWNQVSPGNDGELAKAIDCGFAVRSPADKLLDDAELKGFRMAAPG